MELESGRRNSVMVLKISYDVMNDELSWLLTKVLVGRCSNSKWSSLVYRCWGLEPWGAFASSVTMGHTSNWSKVGEQEKERKQKEGKWNGWGGKLHERADQVLVPGWERGKKVQGWLPWKKGSEDSEGQEVHLRSKMGNSGLSFIGLWERTGQKTLRKVLPLNRCLAEQIRKKILHITVNPAHSFLFSVLLLISPEMGERDQVKGVGSRRARGR